MTTWQVVLAVVMAAVVALIIFGALWDRDRTARRAAVLASPPDRPIPGLESADAPAYLSEAQARRTPQSPPPDQLTAAQRDELRAAMSTAVEVAAGWHSPDYVTDAETGWAILHDPVVLLAADPLVAVRDLLPIIERAKSSGRSLVLVTPGLAPSLQRTLEVNRIQRHLRLVVVTATAEIGAQVARATGATAVERIDLQSGWLPEGALGSAHVWVSDRRRSWIIRVLEPADDSESNPEASPNT